MVVRSMTAFAVVCVLAVTFGAFGVSTASAFETRAEYAVLMDADTGTVFYEKNADRLMAPASMSKLMTIAILFDRIKNGQLHLTDEFHVSEKAWRMGGSKMWTKVDTTIAIEDLIRGIVVQSGNDACVVVAEGISGSEDAFALEMTRFGREEIGLEKSTFGNSTGWPDPDQLMTARELAMLARHIITAYPDLYHYFAETEFEWSDIKQPNRNPLLYANIGADGLKTGHTEESGYGLTASAVSQGRRLILVVNGLSSESERSTESQRLLRMGFRDFLQYELFKAGDVVGNAQVWQGNQSKVPLTIENDLTAILKPQARKDMEVVIQYEGPLQAPIQKGDEIAKLIVKAPDAPEIERPLFAAVDVPRQGLFGRIGSGLVQMVVGQFTPKE